MPSDIRYPLATHYQERLRSASGLPFENVSMENVLGNHLSARDLGISSDTLVMQAEIAGEAGYLQLSANLLRAAELVRMPDDVLLRVYTALRPRRSTYPELIGLADELENRYEATLVSEMVREAAEVYRGRDLLMGDSQEEKPT